MGSSARWWLDEPQEILNVTTATTEPEEVIVGDTWTWSRSFSDYPASQGWVLTYYVKNDTQSFQISCTANGNDHVATMSAANSAALVPGTYRYWARISLSGTSYTVAQGELKLLPNPAAQGAYDFRTTATRIVDALEQLALRRAGGRQQVTVDGIAMVFDTQADIIKALGYWRQQVANEQQADRIAKGLGSRRTIRVRM